MNRKTYLAKRREAAENIAAPMGFCMHCRQRAKNCYCGFIQRFDPKIKFVILAHAKEAKRHIASGRLTQLCLENSEFIRGHDYRHKIRVNEILRNPEYHCVLLYPGIKARNLTSVPESERAQLFPRGKQLVIFVLDGTWVTASKMLKVSQNLHLLPQVSFDPPGPSRFRVRLQPNDKCLSTIEAVHHLIEIVGKCQGFATERRSHDILLEAFDQMVERQLTYMKNISSVNPYRRARPRFRLAKI